MLVTQVLIVSTRCCLDGEEMHLLNVSALVIHNVSCNCMSLAGRVMVMAAVC
jgi:hypothetical protein